MDPSATLITFLLQTNPSVQSVSLIGSWDNFTSSYPMEHDYRRGKGQWKGCHAFRNMVSDDGRPSAGPGGLRMGQTYYYYYEVDASHETFDPSKPSTTMCPSLPGQEVNTLTVPFQKSHRLRSASLSSMHSSNYQATNPADRFLNPRPVPVPSPEAVAANRLRSAPGISRNTPSSRPESPNLSRGPAWRRLFHHERGRSRERTAREESLPPTPSPVCERLRSEATESRASNRSISPESLRRFLSDDVPTTRPPSGLSERPALVIPDNIVEQCDDDDDDDDDGNFATSAVSETNPYFSTTLSPPPYQRTTSSETVPLTTKNLSSLTLDTERPPTGLQSGADTVQETQCSNLTSESSSVLASPPSSVTPDEEHMTFYDDAQDDDAVSPQKADSPPLLNPFAPSPRRPGFTCYSLPREDEDGDQDKTKVERKPTFGIPDAELLAIADTRDYPPPPAAQFLPAPIDSGLDDFASELGWMVNSISSKRW